MLITKYREILRLNDLGLSQQDIVDSCNVSKKTVSRVLKRAGELNISWLLDENETDEVLAEKFFPSAKTVVSAKMLPDFDHIHKELLRNGVSKKLLWTEYMEDCRAKGKEPLMYSQFCYHIQQDEQKRRATMHISRKPGEQVEVDWAGDTAYVTDPDTGEIIKAYIFVGAMTYSQYAYVEAFPDMKERSWITAHVHMYEFFGGIAKILVPDNCKTAVIHNNGWKDQQINETYQEMAEHYGTAVIPARVRSPKDKPNAEGMVGNISTWITATLRNEQFFTFSCFLQALFGKSCKVKMDNREYNSRKDNRQKRLIKNAGFDKPEANILDINYTSGRKLNKALIKRLATCEYITDHRNLIITGATGCGKTYMACAFGMEACKQYYNTKYIRIPELLMELEESRSNRNFRKTLAKYANPVVLILDEWLLMKPNESEQKDILELIHHRRKKSSTIFCSQYGFDEWYEQLGGNDSPISDAIIDRIAHDSYMINITSIDAEHDISMREVYGLDKKLRE